VRQDHKLLKNETIRAVLKKLESTGNCRTVQLGGRNWWALFLLMLLRMFVKYWIEYVCMLILGSYCQCLTVAANHQAASTCTYFHLKRFSQDAGYC